MKNKNRVEFAGKITMVSVSPHGDPEGLVLDDGSFIKVPPHSLIEKEKIKVGATVSGTGELLENGPNEAYHHVQLMVGKTVVSDDSLGPKESEELKEKHKKENKKRGEVEAKKISFRGKAIAFGSKPKGEIDRILLEDGTSVHIPKDLELDAADYEVGSEFEITGEEKRFGDLRFVKAKSVQQRA